MFLLTSISSSCTNPRCLYAVRRTLNCFIKWPLMYLWILCVDRVPWTRACASVWEMNNRRSGRGNMDELYKQALGWMRANELPLHPSSDKPQFIMVNMEGKRQKEVAFLENTGRSSLFLSPSLSFPLRASRYPHYRKADTQWHGCSIGIDFTGHWWRAFPQESSNFKTALRSLC